MSDELDLFGASAGHADAVLQPSAPTEVLPDWQVAAIRTALDRAGLVDMTARQEAVERLVGRPVESLRALTASEASQVRDGLPARSQPRASAWDDREEDTWIDKL